MSYEICAEKYSAITRQLIKKKLTITTMESCTSGMLASLITDTEGSSAVMKGAFITYSNEAKIRCGVPSEIISCHGVYSRETASAMAESCARYYGADIGIGITGSFGNADPHNADSVPGEIYFAIRAFGNTETFFLSGITVPNRHEGKYLAAEAVADELLKIL